MADPDQLPPAIRGYLRGYVLRGRRLAVLRGVGTAGCVFLAMLLATAVADRFIQFPAVLRMTMLAVAGMISVAVILRPLLQLSKPEVDWLAVAGRIEEQNDRFGQRLQTVASRMLGRSDYRGSDEILEQLSYELDREAVNERPSRLLPARRAAGPWLLLAVLVAVAYGMWQVPDINLPQLGLRFLTPWQPHDPVTTTQLAVLPGDRDLLQGTPATIDAAVSRLGGGLVWLHVAEGAEGDESRAPWQKFPMAIREAPGDGSALRKAFDAAAGPAGLMQFAYTLTSIDRDVRYYVTAGDARSHTFTLRVLRKPAITEFRVRYLYPVHTGRPPLSVSNTDGKLEAPAGTEAEITIVATEPLKSALLTYAGETVAMTRPADDATGRYRSAKLLLSRDGRMDFGLVSTREQAGVGPVTAEVKAVPDRTPVVRIGNTGQTLRLGPRDLLPISYEAIDDFGVQTLVLRAQVGSAAPVEFAVAGATGDPATEPAAAGPLGGALRAISRTAIDNRRREGLYDMDLARLPLAIGDVLTLALVGRDTSNQVSVSEAIHVLVSPKSVGIDTYELISELDAAALLAGSAADDLTEAVKRIEAADNADPTSLAGGRASRRFMSAGSSAALVRRALIRGIGREPNLELSNAMLAWIDDAQVVSASAEVLFRELGGDSRWVAGGGSDGPPSPRSRASRADLLARTKDLAELSRRLTGQLRAAASGQRAAVVLADLENAAATEKRGAPKQDKPAADRYKQSLARLKEDIAAAGKSLDLNPSAGDFRQKLQTLIDRARDVARGRQTVDYIAAAREWSQQVQRNAWHPITFDDRLSAAAQAEAVRPGGDLRIARDFSLASAAAAGIEAAGDRSRPVPVNPATANGYVSAMEALHREHRTFRRPTDILKDDEQAIITANADKARQMMQDWAGLASPGLASSAQLATTAPPAATLPSGSQATRTAALESAALKAGAAAADGNFDAADRIDASLAAQLSGGMTTPLAGDLSQQAMEKARRAVGSARTIDAAQETQQSLAAQTAGGGDVDAATLAARQRDVASRLEQASAQRSPLSTAPGEMFNARDKAGEAYLTAQNRLVAMPQQIADLLEADTTLREATERARRAKEELDRAPPDRKAAAKRMVEMALQEQESAAAAVAEQAGAIGPAIGQTMLATIDAATEQSSAARDVIGTQLTPALKSLADAATGKSGDRAKVDRAAAEARQAIDAAQLAVAKSQEELAMQDPLTSAKWYARAAADALSRKPPDFRAAERSQRSAVVAMGLARDQTLRYASGQRMLAVQTARPQMVAAADAPAAAISPAAGTPSPWSVIADQWRRLRSRDMEDGTGLLHQTDPPGYEAAIKAYFEALDKQKEPKGK